MDTNNLKHNDIKLPKFIDKLKKIDKKTNLIFKVVKISYILIIAFQIIGFSSILIWGSMNDLLDSIHQLFIFVGMILVCIYLVYRGKDYKNIDYSQSTYIMLQKTSDRYKPFLKKDVWILPGLLFMMSGISLDSPMGFWNAQLFFFGILLISGLIGFVYWYFRWKPIKDNADKLIKEMES